MAAKFSLRRWRGCTTAAVVVVALTGAFTHLVWGTPSSFGFDSVTAVCPLGALEAALAAGTFVPRLLVALGVTVLATVLLGRVFCAWGCPIPYVQRLFSSKRSPAANAPVQAGPAGPEAAARRERAGNATRYCVLAGTLLSSAIFGFPVFCLVCPIGLFFGTLFALMRLLRFNEPTVLLLVFPAMLFLELVALRRWCGRFCPVGALLGLLGRFNRTLVPRVDARACMVTSRGASCFACRKVCPEDIDLHAPDAGRIGGECTKCGDCLDVCPTRAIHFLSKEKSHVHTDGNDERLARQGR